MLTEMLETAIKAQKEGEMTADELIVFMKQCVNVRAMQNGYAEKYGLPFPERIKPRT